VELYLIKVQIGGNQMEAPYDKILMFDGFNK
jgi:hypothetical protein